MSDHAAVKSKELVRDLREGFESNLERARLTTNSVTGLEAAASAARMRIDDLESSIAAAIRDERVKALEDAAKVIDNEVSLREKFYSHMETITALAEQIRNLKKGEA